MVCLQEVDRYDDVFGPALAADGFDSFWTPRHAAAPDGIVLGWRASRFSVACREAVELPGSSTTPVLAPVARLICSTSGAEIQVTGLHLNSSRPDLRTAQCRELSGRLLDDRIQGSQAALLLLGDFNAVPEEDALSVLTAGDMCPPLQCPWRARWDGVGKPARFPRYTCRDRQFSGTIDYIWHSAGLEVQGIEPGGEDRDAAPLLARTGLSDHLPLVGTFGFRE